MQSTRQYTPWGDALPRPGQQVSWALRFQQIRSGRPGSPGVLRLPWWPLYQHVLVLESPGLLFSLLLPRGRVQSPTACSVVWMDPVGWPGSHWALLSHPLPCPAQPSAWRVWTTRTLGPLEPLEPLRVSTQIKDPQPLGHCWVTAGIWFLPARGYPRGREGWSLGAHSPALCTRLPESPR